MSAPWRPHAREGRALSIAAALALVALVAFLAACAPGGAASSDTTGQTSNGPRLGFKARAHDFGRLSASRKTEYQFAFTNAGSETLQLGEITLLPGGPGG